MKRLKKLRQSRNLSQQKLAEEFHISQQSIWKYENNISEPDISTLINFANYFDVSVDYLIGNSDIPEKADRINENQLTSNETFLIHCYRSMSPKIQSLIFELVKEWSKNTSNDI